MFNPLEMFQAQGEAGIQAMAQQFGLTPEQTARAFEALMPALTLGLQRGAGLDPNAFARMFGMPEVARAAAPQGLEALTQMFGSAQLMQAVLRQASATSGVGAQVLRQMLPMMAGAVVASIVHVMLNQPQAEPAQARPAAPPPPVPFPFGPAWGEMAKAFMPGATAAPAPPPKPAPKAASKTAGEKAGEAGSAMIEHMMRTGAEVQGHNIRAMQELFETLWPSSGKPADPPKPEPTPPKPRRGRGPEGGAA
jgi:hypothetical protein